MACKKWNESINQILIEKYANIKNEELAKEFGYSLRTIERHARMLGLRKSKEFMRQTQLEASRKGTLELEYRSLIGLKRKGHCKGRVFKKGNHLQPEIEKKRIESIRRRAWEDRKRIIHGMTPVARWRYDLKAYESLKDKND